MSYKRFVKDYLTFSKNERIAGFILLSLLVIFYLPGRLFKSSEAITIEENQELARMFDAADKKDSAIKNEEDETNSFSYHYTPEPEYLEGDLFKFDPNTLPAEGWKKLGLNEKTTKTLLNYRNKGGRFYKPEDLKKIWGMPTGFYERVRPYINLPEYASNYELKPIPGYKPDERKILVVDINQADTTEFIALPGIGNKLANRIINFREKLGGFYSIEQVGETYGVPDSTFQYIRKMLKVLPGMIRKININTATKDELKMHPYIKWNLANAIVEYRNQHGDYSNLSELRNIAIIDETAYNKMLPYLSVSSIENE